MRLIFPKRLRPVSLVFIASIFSVLVSIPASTQTPQCIHGMRIVGDKSIYLSHMPLFGHSCHKYQVLLEATFKGDRNPQKKYLQDQAKNPTQNEYTLEPIEKFWLPGLASGKIKSFRANIHRGQYERNSTPQLLAHNVTVEVKRVLHFRELNPNVNTSRLSEYLLFGNRSEQYLAHLITAPPDFDQILAVKGPLTLTGAQLGKAVQLVLPDRPITNSQRKVQQALKPNDQAVVLIKGKSDRVRVGVGIEYFLEASDLTFSHH